MDTVSIIVPIYKVEKYLDRCIKSIINQSYKKIEIILVNDGSPDKCAEICNYYAKRDNRIKVIHKNNGGLSDARNKGLDVSTGKYITFIDGDDYINRYYIESLYKGIKQSKTKIAICGYDRVNEIECKDKYFKNEISIIDNMKALSNLYDNNKRLVFVVAWGKLFEKGLFDNIRFPKGKINEDSFILYKLYLKTNKVYYNEAKLYYYCIRNNSITNSSFKINNLDDLEALEEQINFFRNHKYLDIEKKVVKIYCQFLGKYYKKAKNSNNLEACRLIKKKYKNVILNLNKKEYLKEELNFLYQPWFYPKFIKVYWILISLKNNIFNNF